MPWQMWHTRKQKRQRRLSARLLKFFLLPLFATILFALLNTSYSAQVWNRVHNSVPEAQEQQRKDEEELQKPALPPPPPPPPHFNKYVNTFIGTGGQGHTYPGATVPFGMVQLSPDNGNEGWAYSSGYHYNASTIIGFSHTHLSGTGIGDLLDISVQPTLSPINSTSLKEFWDLDLRQSFNHSNEVAEPGYYSVFMDHGVQVELTATERTGMHRYTFYPPSATKNPFAPIDSAAFEPQSSASSSEYLPGIVLNLCFALNTDALEASLIELTSISSSDDLINGTWTTSITGYRKSTGWAENHHVYFAMEFSVPLSAVTLIQGAEVETVVADNHGMMKGVAEGEYTIAYFTFDNLKNSINSDNNITTDPNNTGDSADENEEEPLLVLLKIGISSVSVEGAKDNLRLENPNWDFDSVRQAAAAAWESELRKIVVQGGTEEAKSVFYTSLYHTKLAPTILSDISGAYRGPDSQIHRVLSGSNIRSGNLVTSASESENDNSYDANTSFSPDYYSTFSIWDTFRAAHPLLTILNPDRVKDMMRTFLAHADHQGGLLPFWPLAGVETRTMPGYHAAVMLTEAAKKNLLSKQDIKRAYKAMKGTAMDVERGGALMHRFGFIPAGKKDESVTVTLELSYDDWCIAQIAEILGRHKDAAYFYKRSQGYKRVFDPETQFMRAKFKNNTWKTRFNPRQSEHEGGDYTEGTAWQHLWFVPHDIPGLIKLFNGSANFEAKLDALFQENPAVVGLWTSEDISGMIGQYAHGNEPSHHVAYLYNYLGSPHKTQARAREIVKQFYRAEPEGYVGNEDCGQMSAWYIFSALGFYPVNPAEAKYQLGSPIFDHAVIDVGQGRKFEVKAQGAGTRGDVFVKNVSLNGELLRRLYITHDEIMNGGVLELEMSSKID